MNVIRSNMFIMLQSNNHVKGLMLMFALATLYFGVTTAESVGTEIALTDFTKQVAHGESVYHFYNESCCNNDEANSTCNKFGGFLAHVKTQQVSDFIKDQVVSDFIDYRKFYFSDMMWIGLHQIGENNSIWEWSDGTPLEDGINNQNWNKYWYDEPNNPDEKCVGVATKRCNSEQSGTCMNSNEYVGQWADRTCTIQQKFICENPYGSGFVSTETVAVGADPETVSCTVFGDTSYSATWYRNGSIIPSSANERIYQQIDENTEYRTSTITFANPILESDEGDYVCLLRNNEQVVSNLTVQLQTDPYLSVPDLPIEHKISETQNIRCTASGRPIPTITWKIGDVNLERNDQIFQVFNTINNNTLTSESVFSIINPISFEGNTQLSCVAEVVDKNLRNISHVQVNTDFSDFDGSSYVVNEITSEQECEIINGIFTGSKCKFVAAEMVETEGEKCEGSELSIQIRDFTETATTILSLAVEGNRSFVTNPYATKSSGNNKTILIPNLNPRSDYKIEVKYRPTYWTNQVVTISETFKTKGKIPEAMNITRAKITLNDECKVEFVLPMNIKTSQLHKILVNVSEIGQNAQNYQMNHIKYTEGMSSFYFKTTNDESTYKFTTKLITCAGDIGDETGIFECSRDKVNAALIGGCVGGAVLIIIIIIIAVILYYRKHKSKKPKTVVVDAQPEFNGLHNLKKLSSVTCESVHENRVATVTPHGINSKCLLENYNFLMASEKKELISLFKKLREGTKTKTFSASACTLKKNATKNRYKNVVPYDETRVILSTDEGINSSDYINASWINGYQRKKRFIATQGPTLSTTDDFWRMIYETDCKVIVMLTNIIEGKCEQYWPDRSRPYKSENFTIRLIMEQKAAAHIIRTFTVTLNVAPKEIRAVTQFQFICWPVHGIPVITSPILRFYNEVMQFANTTNDEFSPVVVHCSAGVGRTGTFISLDILTEMLNNEGYVDIYQTVFDLRLQRMDMVQTLDQFAFLHKLVVESYLFGNTDFSITEFLKMLIDQDKLNQQLEDDFTRLNWIPAIINDKQNLVQVKTVKSAKDKEKRSTLPQLKTDVHFNGSWIENFCGGRKIISAETPQASKIETFLNVLVENSVSIVVMISEKGQKNLYWPKKADASKQFGDTYVQNTSVSTDKDFPTRTLTIVSSAQDLPPHTVQLIKVDSWKDSGLSDDESDVLYNKTNHLIQTIDELWDDNSTILIHCKDGSNYSGTLCALLQINERLKLENKVDLFRVVKDLRDTRLHMVRTLGQYKFCHWVTEAFIQSLHTYAYIK